MKTHILSLRSLGLAALTALALIHLAAPAVPADNLTIHCINVGQGDATLIISPTGGTLLFDAGNNGRGTGDVIHYMQTYGIQALDYIVASN